MGRFSAYLFNQFRSWEFPTRLGFISAFVILILAFLLWTFGPETTRQSALIGMIGSVFALQIIFMWGNRNMVTPYTQAQRYYLAENFDAARKILETLLDTGKPDISSLTLLANTYRQMGLLAESEEIVKKALDLRPFDHFPLYSFGRTLLMTGRYKQAGEVFQQALEAGAPPIVRFDLGEALYRQDRVNDALEVFESLPIADLEAFRALMTQYWLFRAGVGGRPSSQLLTAGMPYWTDQAHRFRHTAYGQDLAIDIDGLRMLVEA